MYTFTFNKVGGTRQGSIICSIKAKFFPPIVI